MGAHERGEGREEKRRTMSGSHFFPFYLIESQVHSDRDSRLTRPRVGQKSEATVDLGLDIVAAHAESEMTRWILRTLILVGRYFTLLLILFSTLATLCIKFLVTLPETDFIFISIDTI